MFDLDRLAAFERGLAGDRSFPAPVRSAPQMPLGRHPTGQPPAAPRGCPHARSEEVAA